MVSEPAAYGGILRPGVVTGGQRGVKVHALLPTAHRLQSGLHACEILEVFEAH